MKGHNASNLSDRKEYLSFTQQGYILGSKNISSSMNNERLKH
jgi:hypothetical protein